MAKEKVTKEATKEVTFHCKFCGESKPLSEMTFITRFYPILIACRSCEIALQSLKPEEPAVVEAEEVDEEAAEETTADTKD
jgi:transcription elongation factor Elf1